MGSAEYEKLVEEYQEGCDEDCPFCGMGVENCFCDQTDFEGSYYNG